MPDCIDKALVTGTQDQVAVGVWGALRSPLPLAFACACAALAVWAFATRLHRCESGSLVTTRMEDTPLPCRRRGGDHPGH